MLQDRQQHDSDEIACLKHSRCDPAGKGRPGFRLRTEFDSLGQYGTYGILNDDSRKRFADFSRDPIVSLVCLLDRYLQRSINFLLPFGTHPTENRIPDVGLAGEAAYGLWTRPPIH